MGQCTELKWSGDVAYLPAPIFKTDCAARYPDHYPDYVDGVDYKFYGGGATDFITYEPELNRFKLAAYDVYFNTHYPEQPAKVTISVKAIPKWRGEYKYTWPGSFTVYFNNRWEDVGSLCGYTSEGLEEGEDGAGGGEFNPDIELVAAPTFDNTINC